MKIPIDYLIIYCGYTGRLMNDKYQKELFGSGLFDHKIEKPNLTFEQKCKLGNIIFIKDELWSPKGRELVLCDPRCPDIDELISLTNNMSGTIAFHAKNTIEAFNIYRDLQTVEFCAFLDVLHDIELFMLKSGKQVLVLHIDSESG